MRERADAMTAMEDRNSFHVVSLFLNFLPRLDIENTHD